jgi:hypothetical protein
MYAGNRHLSGIFAVWRRRRRRNGNGPHLGAVLLVLLRAFLILLRIAVSVETLPEQRTQSSRHDFGMENLNPGDVDEAVVMAGVDRWPAIAGTA